MTEFLFYQLHRQRTEDVLPALLEKSLERGWRVVVQCAAEERLDALDAQLWTYRDDSFLPHGTFRETAAADQPVLLTLGDHNPNAATVRFLIDGAPPPALEDAAQYDRVVLLFDGEDEEAVAAARQRSQAAAARGFVVTYWQADKDGRWRRPSAAP
jgi:DNA polymerase III subunit chi